MQTALFCALVAAIFVCIVSPLLWVAMFNIVGLKRLSQRLDIVEDECDRFDAKGKSLQSQIRKTKARETPPDPDAEINAKIDELMRGNGMDASHSRTADRGGLRDG